MKRIVTGVVIGIVALALGAWWIAVIVGMGLLLVLIRDYGPADPEPKDPCPTVLRRRQLDRIIDRDAIHNHRKEPQS